MTEHDTPIQAKINRLAERYEALRDRSRETRIYIAMESIEADYLPVKYDDDAPWLAALLAEMRSGGEFGILCEGDVWCWFQRPNEASILFNGRGDTEAEAVINALFAAEFGE